MFCINCGAKLPEGARFCHKCGAKAAPELAGAESAQAEEKPSGTESTQTEEEPTGTADAKAAKHKSIAWLWMPTIGIALGLVIIVLMEMKPNLFSALSGGKADSSGKRAERSEESEEYEEYAPESDEEGDSPQISESENSQTASGSLTGESDVAGDDVSNTEDAEVAAGNEEDEGVYEDDGDEIDLALGVIEKTAYLVDDSYHQLLQLEPDGTFTLTVNLLEGMGQVYGTYAYYEDRHYEFYVDGRDFRGFQGDDVWGFDMEPESSSCLVYMVDYYYIGMVSPGMKFYLRDTPTEATDWWDNDRDNADVMQYGDLDLLNYLGEYSGWSNGNEIMVDIWWRDEESVNVSILWFEGSDIRRKHTFFTKPTLLSGNVLRFVMGDDEWHKLEIIPGYASESGYPTIFLDGDKTWPIVMVDVDNQPT